MTRYRLRILGSPLLVSATNAADILVRPGKPLALLAYLAVQEEPVSRDDLADLLWPGADRRHSRASLRQALWILRQELGEEIFESEDPVHLSSGRISTDLESFRAALRRGDISTAFELWTGPPLQELQFPGVRGWVRWADELRTREEERFGAALSRAAEQAAQEGNLTGARALWRKALDVEPARLSHHFGLVRCLLDFHDLDGAEETILSVRRFADDDESRRALEDLTARLLSLRQAALRNLEPHALRPGFVGRSPEFSLFSRQWKEAKEGLRRCGIIQGPPGIGKTRLAEEMALLVGSEGGRSVRVKATEVESSLEWGTFGELARELHALPGAAGISRRSSQVLTRLLPSLDQGAPRRGREGPSRESEPTALADAFRDLVAAVAEEQPLMLVVDDLQWADRKSQAALVQSIRSLSRAPVFFVLISRTGGGDKVLASTLESLKRVDWVRDVTLGPLEETEVAELLALLLEPTEPRVLSSFAQQVHGISRGNPLFIVELLKLLQNEGYVESVGEGRWALDPACVRTPLPVPETIEAAIERRLKDLSATSRILAAHMARPGLPNDTDRLRLRAKLPEWEVTVALEEMTEQDLIRQDAQGRWSFVHDTAREVASRILPPVNGNDTLPILGRVRPWWAGVWGFGLGGLATALLLMGGLNVFGSTADPFQLPRTRLSVVRAGDTVPDEWVELTLRGRRVSQRPRPAPGPVQRSPDGRWRVEHARTPTGSHLLLHDSVTGREEIIMPEGGDHMVESFSPDGRLLLYSEGEAYDQNRRYRRRLGTYALETGEARQFPFDEPPLAYSAAWSPDGTRIAFLTEEDDPRSVCVTDLEGAAPRCRSSAGRGALSRPAWSPDGSRIAASVIESLESGLLVLSADGEQSSVIGASLDPLGQPVWLTESILALVAGSPGQGDLWLIDIDGPTPRVKQITESGDLRGIEGVAPLDPPRVWIETVSLEPRVFRASPGQYIRLTAILQEADGDSLDPGGFPIGWDVSDPGVASVSDSGLVKILAEGTVTVSATAGGWRTASVTLTSLPLLEMDAPLLFEEDWTEGLREAEWRPHGFPHPFVRVTGGPDGGGYFVNNGDDSYPSGAVSLRSFPVTRGLTVTTRADLQFHGGLFQDFSLGVVADPAIDPNGERRDKDGDLKVNMEAVKPFTEVWLGSRKSVSLPLPDSLTGWRECGLQIGPGDGVVSILFDNQLFWRSEPGFWTPPENGQVFLDLRGRSVDAEVKHGTVKVYAGEKYVLPQATQRVP